MERPLSRTLPHAATDRLGGCVQSGIAFACLSITEIDPQVALSA